MDSSAAAGTIGILAQSIRDTGGEVDVTAIIPWAIGVLSGVVLVVSLWRGFKSFLNEGKDGAAVSAESRAKSQIGILVDAGIVIACIAVGTTVIGFVSQFLINKIG